MSDTELYNQAAEILHKVLETLMRFSENLKEAKDNIVQIFSDNSNNIETAEKIKSIFDGTGTSISIISENDTLIKSGKNLIKYLMSPGNDSLFDLLLRGEFLEALFFEFGRAQSTINDRMIRIVTQIIFMIGNMLKGGKSRTQTPQSSWDDLNKFAKETLKQLGGEDL